MLQRGDWVVPTHNGRLFVEKPPLMYWTMIAGFQLFGTSEFGARIGAAILGAAAALVTYHLGRRLFSARVGFWAGIILASTIGFTISARAATVDASLTLLSSLAMLAFVVGTRGWGLGTRAEGSASRVQGSGEEGARDQGLGTRDEGSGFRVQGSGTAAGLKGPSSLTPSPQSLVPAPQSLVPAPQSLVPSPQSLTPSLAPASTLAMWAAMAIAVLAKGPVGLLLPAAAIGLFLMIANARAGGEWRAAGGGWRAALAALARVVRPGNFLRSLWQMRRLVGIAMVVAIAAPWFVWVGRRTGGQWTYEFFVTWNFRPFTQSIQGHSGPIWYHLVGVLLLFFPWSVFMGPTLADAVRQGRRDVARRPAYVLLACWIGVWLVFWSLCKTKLPHHILPAYPALALLCACFLHGWLTDPARAKRWEMPTAMAITMLVGVGLVVATPIVAPLYIPGDEVLAAIGLPLVLGGAVCLYCLRRALRPRMLTAFALSSIVFLTALFGFGAARVDRHQNARPLMAEIRQACPGHFQLAGFQFLPKSFVYYAGEPVTYCRTMEDLRAFLDRSEHPYVIAHGDQVGEIEQELPGQLAVFTRQRRFLRCEDIVVLSGHAGGITVGQAFRPATR